MDKNINFPSDNEFDIPSLSLRHQARNIPLPLKPWGGISSAWRASRNLRFPGTWQFYIDDRFFNTLWKKPEAVVATACGAVCEVNYTTRAYMPRWKALELIGKKRWLSRYFADYGKSILVDLNVCDKYLKDNLLGVPRGWRAYSTRASDRDIDSLQIHYATAIEHAATKNINMLVYGGGSKVQAFCREHLLQHFPTAQTAFHDDAKSG